MATIAKPISTQMSGSGSFVSAGGSGKLHNISQPPKKVTPNMIEAQPSTKQGLMKNGTTVTGNAGVYGTELADTANDAYNNSVAVRDYATSKGYGGIVDWDGKNPTIGGSPIPMKYNQNGTAYVDPADADRAIKQYEQRAGIIGNKQVVDNYNSKYGSAIEAALNRVVGRDPYNPDVESDAAFQKYSDFYTRQADDAMRKVLNQNNASLGGASGAVLAEAIAARDNYLDKINTEYKDFEQKKYERYLDSYDMMRNDMSDIIGIANDAYNREYQANRDAISDSRTSMLDERTEKWKQTEYNDGERVRDIDYLQALENLEGTRIQNEGSEIQNRGSELANISTELANEASRLGIDMTKFDNAIKYASSRGKFIKSDEALIPWLAEFSDGNGGYTLSPWEYELLFERGLAYAQAAGQYQAYNEFNAG